METIDGRANALWKESMYSAVSSPVNPPGSPTPKDNVSTLRLRYQTIEFRHTDIHVRTLRDRQEFSDDKGIAAKLGITSSTWSLFGVIWDSGMVLAHLMQHFDFAGKRILEVGCGIGLSSLVLNSRGANITATDYHPEAQNFLNINAGLNQNKTIPFVRTGWADRDSCLGKFDVIIGSDLLYEPNHADLLSGFIHKHASQPCEIIIIDPGRRQRARFSQAMRALGYSHCRSRPDTSGYILQEAFGGYVLEYKR